MAAVPIQVLALGITLFCVALTICVALLPILIKFFRFTGLWLPIITMIVLCLIKVPESIEAVFVKFGIAFWIFTLVIAVFLFLKNIIRLFKPEFAYLKLLKRNKADDDAICSITFRTDTPLESGFIMLDRKEYDRLLESKEQYEQGKCTMEEFDALVKD